ncbi:hypothetical protein GCM10017771_73940 [Streptomyces capitiformicae]|uniref:Uncharacterized protein n=1 Tax=Streptomyces capitiformicae TaxID=2014920 RepID=A0A918ZGI6_9ACTN|nr:hypothetical protein GCM10017771_73940 [Streptomyces capitiformicae]
MRRGSAGASSKFGRSSRLGSCGGREAATEQPATGASFGRSRGAPIKPQVKPLRLRGQRLKRLGLDIYEHPLGVQVCVIDGKLQSLQSLPWLPQASEQAFCDVRKDSD